MESPSRSKGRGTDDATGHGTGAAGGALAKRVFVFVFADGRTIVGACRGSASSSSDERGKREISVRIVNRHHKGLRFAALLCFAHCSLLRALLRRFAALRGESNRDKTLSSALESFTIRAFDEDTSRMSQTRIECRQRNRKAHDR